MVQLAIDGPVIFSAGMYMYACRALNLLLLAPEIIFCACHHGVTPIAGLPAPFVVDFCPQLHHQMHTTFFQAIKHLADLVFQLMYPFFLVCDFVFSIYTQLTQMENGSLSGLYKTQGLMAVTRVGYM